MKRILLLTISLAASAFAQGNAVNGKGQGITNPPLFRQNLGLGNVENIAISTWQGSSNITTLGTITSGTIPVARVSGLGTAATLSVGTTAGTVAAGDDARFTTNLGYTASNRILTSSTGADVTFPIFTSSEAGLVPASGGGTSNYLRADGTWAPPTGGGDLLAANNLSDLLNAAAARTNLGLGTAATTNSTAYATAAQGTTADGALQRSGGTMAGALSLGGYGISNAYSAAGAGVSATTLTGSGVYGSATSGYGLRGSATTGYGVFATSDDNTAIYAQSTTGAGIEAYAATTALYGRSPSAIGVYGSSDSSLGLLGESDTGAGLRAVSASGTYHAIFGNNGIATDDILYVSRVNGDLSWIRDSANTPYTGTLTPTMLSGNATWNLPNGSGTLATTSQSSGLIVSMDITDATTDGAANPEKLLKTDSNGDLTISNLRATTLLYPFASAWINLQSYDLSNAGYSTLNWVYGHLKSTSGGVNSLLSVNWESRKLYAGDGTTVMLDWLSPGTISLGNNNLESNGVAYMSGYAGGTSGSPAASLHPQGIDMTGGSLTLNGNNISGANDISATSVGATNGQFDSIVGGGSTATDFPAGLKLNNATIPTPTSSEDGKFLKYDHGTTAFVYQTISGGGDLLAANNLSDLASAATARTNLGVAIGTDVQAYSSVLDATTASFLTAQETKLGHISVTQAVNLDTMESDIATNNAKVTNATHTGDATGATALTVVAINGTNLAALGTGILKNTTGTGVPSIAVAGTDYLTPTGSAAGLTSFPTLNQNTTGSAATLTTPRSINGVAFDGSADITVTAAAGTLTGATLNAGVTGSSLTTLGTITSGTWNGTAIGDSYISSASTWNAKQAALVSGTNIKTINSTSLLGSGDISITPNATHTGDVTGSTALTLATVNSNVGSYGSSTATATFTVNAKGLITAAGSTTVTPAIGSITGLGTNVANFLATPSASNFNAATTGDDFVTLTGSETVTNKTLTNPSINNFTEGVVAIGTVTTAHTFSLTSGTVQTATLTASTACTFTMPTASAGKSFVVYLKQAASTGNGTATFTSVKWPGGTAPTITATAGRMDIISFLSDGTNWYGSYTQNFAP